MMFGTDDPQYRELRPTAAGWGVVNLVDGTILAADKGLETARRSAWYALVDRLAATERRHPSGLTQTQIGCDATYQLAVGYEPVQVTRELLDYVSERGGGARVAPNEHHVLRLAELGDGLLWEGPEHIRYIRDMQPGPEFGTFIAEAAARAGGVAH